MELSFAMMVKMMAASVIAVMSGAFANQLNEGYARVMEGVDKNPERLNRY